MKKKSITQLQPKLAIILVDGFRWDYEERMTDDDLPIIKALVDDGVKVEGRRCINNFP